MTMGRKRVDSKQVAIRLNKETWDWLESQASLTGNTVSGLVRDGLYLLLKEQKLIDTLRGGMESSGISYPGGNMIKPDGSVSQKKLAELGLKFR
jgi:hypothetical protein